MSPLKRTIQQANKVYTHPIPRALTALVRLAIAGTGFGRVVACAVAGHPDAGAAWLIHHGLTAPVAQAVVILGAGISLALACRAAWQELRSAAH
ncbi:hypothetical protein FB474_0103 [Oryzihumus leptocrescens]|uniref:Uncharacterized protein n=1 Tax=Oryzihumus leptocrescens TaxID=297536 RepID=A0A542ZEJ3_9MICO|nr:hypothetical protein FB474_0103 [Oryzihumus leptocrescens]